MPTPEGMTSVEARWSAWFAGQGWRVASFQRAVWRHYLAGRSGLIHAPTGSGKTLAAWGAVLQSAMGRPDRAGLRVLWITPLRALASDTLRQLQAPISALDLPFAVAMRTGDSTAAQRRKLREQPPFALVTTPESLSVLLSFAEQQQTLSGLDAVWVDEWHELLGNKRGVQLQLCLARLRRLNPGLKVWGISATLGNLDEALATLCPAGDGVLVQAAARKRIVVDSLRPDSVARYPWSGHLGLKQLPRVLAQIARARSTLVFTNTRSQAELWHQALAAVWTWDPESLGLHHASIEREQRREIERGLLMGRLRAVVCTSSLDLGVDFGEVDQVIQIGSPKGIARLVQRAGRCGHRPGASSRIWCVATHALELAEIAAARDAVTAGCGFERRAVPVLSLDVLCQHLVTLALGGGFHPESLLPEIQSAWSFRQLDASVFAACLRIVTQGGEKLERYPGFRRVVIEPGSGLYHVPDSRIATLHRFHIGTIVSDGQIAVRYRNGHVLGQIEEAFISRLKPGDRFLFAGHSLELRRFIDQAAIVTRSSLPPAQTAVWGGSRMPLSTELAAQLRRQLAPGPPRSPELELLKPLLDLQDSLSVRPGAQEWLLECVSHRDGHHAFFHTYAGRLVNEGLAALLAWRLARVQPRSFSMAVSDYGLCLSCTQPFEITLADLPHLLTDDHLVADIAASLNISELAKRQFREVARIAGLLHQGGPGRSKTTRQLMLSAGLLFEVLSAHDPGHLLLKQAHDEILHSQLEITRLAQTLERLRLEPCRLVRPTRLTPFSFALWAERLRQHAGNQDWSAQVAAAAATLSAAATTNGLP